MEKIKVGDIVNTHGIKGEIKVIQTGIETFNRDIDYFIDENCKVKVSNSRIHKNTYILKLEGYDNINDVLIFKGKSIYISKDDLLEVEDEYYHIDLIGIDVYENNEIIGVLTKIDSYEANDVYTIKTKDREIMVPAVDEFILNIDIDNKRMDVRLIEGM